MVHVLLDGKARVAVTERRVPGAVSGVRCQVSGVRCQVSGVRCQVSGTALKFACGWVIKLIRKFRAEASFIIGLLICR